MAEMKDMVNKVTDAIGGTMAKLGAASTTSADGFVEQAAIGDAYEIAAAGIALRRSRNDAVRTTAARMISDHTTSRHHLQAALEMNETRGVALPPDRLDTRRETMLEHLAEASEDSSTGLTRTNRSSPTRKPPPSCEATPKAATTRSSARWPSVRCPSSSGIWPT